MKKRLVLSVVVAILLFATAAAAGQSYLSHYFPTGTPGFEKEIKTEPITGKFGNGKWEVTINESLSDATGTYLAMTLRAASAETAAYLADYDNWESHHSLDFEFYLDGSEESIDSSESAEIHCGTAKNPEDTEDFIEFWYKIETPNPEHKAMILRMKDVDKHPSDFYPEKLTIPTDSKIDSRVIEPNQKTISYTNKDVCNTIKELEEEFTVRKLTLTPLGLNMEISSNEVIFPKGCFFVEMANGTIRSFNQLFAQIHRGGYGGYSDKKPLEGYWVSATIREVKGLENYKSFIIGTTAYPLNGGKPYQVKIDQHLKPFTLSCKEKTTTEVNPLGETYQRPTVWYPVKELCDKLGAGYQWDEAKRCATITHCGQTLTLPLGLTTIQTPGNIHPDTIQTELIDGTLYASRDIIFALRMGDRNTSDNSVRFLFP